MRKYLPYTILILLACALWVRACFGFCSSDEPFYLATTKRFFDGDLIFVHDWFPTQLSSLILLPFYALFVTVFGSADGIILFFRILYVFITLILSVFSYRIISKRNSSPAAFCCSAFMLLFAHLNIATLSYYTMSFEFFIFTMLLFTLKSKRAYVLGGFFFSLTVLSLPSLAIPYVPAFIMILLFSFMKPGLVSGRFRKDADASAGQNTSPSTSCSFKHTDLRDGLIFSTIGIAASLALFVIFLYASGNSIKNLFEYLPYVLSDDEHELSAVAPFKKFFTSISDVYGRVFYLSFLLAFLGLLSNRIKKLLPVVFTADCLLFIYYAIVSTGHTGYMNTALALFAGPLFFMCKKKDWYAFISLFMGGLIFSMTYSYSSNGELYVLSIGHGIACMASILFIDNFIRENRDSRFLRTVPILFLCFFLLETGILRFINVYRDAPLERLTMRICEGPGKGLFTTPEHEEVYSSVLSDIRQYSKDDGFILFSRLLPWGYLASDMRCAGATPWRDNINSRRLEEYYRLFPEREPDLILLLDEDVGSYDSCGDVEADPIPNENEWGGYLGDLIESEGFKEIRCDHLTVYRR